LLCKSRPLIKIFCFYFNIVLKEAIYKDLMIFSFISKRITKLPLCYVIIYIPLFPGFCLRYKACCYKNFANMKVFRGLISVRINNNTVFVKICNIQESSFFIGHLKICLRSPLIPPDIN